MKKHLQLFILWEKSRYKEQEILKDISKKFEIIKTFNIHWEEESFSASLSRLYGKKLPKTNKKKEECGSDDFLVVIINDDNPVYENGKNTNTSAVKHQYRKLVGGNKIHSSDNSQETEDNLLFLLGMNLEEFDKKYQEIWDGKHIKINQDMQGSPYWKSEKTMLDFAKKIPQTEVRKVQNTYLITTNDVNKLCRLLNATRKLLFMKRNLYRIPVKDKDSFVYIRNTI